MNILIADKMAPELISELETLGGEVVYQPDLTAETIPDVVGEAAVLVVRSTKVTAATLAAGSHLQLVVRAGAGVNTIDLEEASNRGIYVANCPGMNTDAVAELAIGLLIAVDRGIADATAALRAGKWQKKRFGQSRGLLGRTLGVVGTGQIGLAVATRAQALGMTVVAWSRSLTPERADALGFEFAETPLALAARSDAVTVHVAAAAETRHLVGAAFFEAMRPGSIFINAARGDVVDSAALTAAMAAKGLRVGLDVYEDEPTGGEAAFSQTPLAALVTCTPHIGASTDQAAQAIGAETLRVVKTFMQTGRAPNVVNLRRTAAAQTHLIIRHFNRVGVLARTLTALRDEGINIEEMQNSIFQTGAAACCILMLDQRPSEATLQCLRSDADIMDVEL